jgi:hypothetical protein
MRCREARALLSLELDDELREADQPRLAHHLDECSRCRAERARYEALRARLRVAEPIAVDLVPALRDRLAGRPVPAVVGADRRVRGTKWPSRSFAVAVAAALVLVVAVALVVPRPARINVATSGPAGAPELRAPTGASLLLAWTTGGLPARALQRTQALVGVLGVTEVRGAELNLTGERGADGRPRLSLPKGAAIPIDALAIDAPGYARDLPAAAARIVRALPRDGALLGATSARLRGIGPGGTLTFGATTVRVTGVVADSLVGAAEVVVRDDSPLPIRTPRFLLVAYRGDRSELESAIGAALRAHVRFRAPGETPYLRQGDAVLPQALVKARFGEFWYRVDARGSVTIDPAWVARNIVSIDLSGVGTLRVHRLVAAALRRALVEVAPAPGTPAVVFAPQLISAGLGLSRHAWGIGLSLVTAPAPGSRTIARLAAAGFVWGGLWLNPSPYYYEWVGAGAP